MGIFTVPIRMRNWEHRHFPPEARAEVVECDALVDTGAIELALPADLIASLRLEQTGTMVGKLADGGTVPLRTYGVVELEVMGRRCRVEAVEFPDATLPLLGSIPLQKLDWHIDARNERLVPRPDSPDGPMHLYCSVA